MQVPFESLRRTTRERKYVIDEVQSVMSTLHEASTRPCSTDEGQKTLDSILHRLEGLKRKVGSSQGCLHPSETLLAIRHIQFLETPIV